MAESITKIEEFTQDKWYDLESTLKAHPDSDYIFAIGGRGDGKTTAILKKIIDNYVNENNQSIYLRRHDESLKPARRDRVWDTLIKELDYITEATDGEYNTVVYKEGGWRLALQTEKELIIDLNIFCFPLSVSTFVTNSKSLSYPNVTILFYEEFMSRHAYLPDEVVDLLHLYSTITRGRDNCKFIFAGNTVDKYSPYFTEFNITEIRKMKPCERLVKTFEEDDEKVKIVVDYTKSVKKPSDRLFIFTDNPKVGVITGGTWEMSYYEKYKDDIKKEDIIYNFYVIYQELLLDGLIVDTEDGETFLYIRNNYYKVIEEEDTIIYNLGPSSHTNYFISLLDKSTKITSLIARLIEKDRVYYDSEETAEAFKSYLSEGLRYNIFK